MKRSVIVMDEEKTTDSKKSKPWRQMLKSESSDNDELTKLLNSDLKKPRMTRSEKQLNKKTRLLNQEQRETRRTAKSNQPAPKTQRQSGQEQRRSSKEAEGPEL